ncbi:MAG: signal peptidase I [Actinomycetes bacterium]
MGLKKFYRETRGLVSTILLFLVLFTPIFLNAVFGVSYSSILSGSMRPAFNPGDVIITQATLSAKLHVGQVAIFRNPTDGTLFAHRIVGIAHKDSHAFFETKGDANPVVDSDRISVPLNQKIPRQIGRVLWVGWAIVYFNNHPITVFLDLIILLLAGYGLKRIIRSKRSQSPGLD